MLAGILHRRQRGVEEDFWLAKRLWMAGFKKRGDEGQRQANDIGVIAFDAGNPKGGTALDGISSGLSMGSPVAT